MKKNVFVEFQVYRSKNRDSNWLLTSKIQKSCWQKSTILFFFQNTSKLLWKDVPGAGKNCPVVYVSIFMKLFDIRPKSWFFGTYFGLLRFQNFWVQCFTCNSELINLKFYKKLFPVCNFQLANKPPFLNVVLISKTNPMHEEGSAMAKIDSQF